MAKKKGKKKNKKAQVPKEIILVNGLVSIECPECLGNSEDCEHCDKKGYIWMKKYTGKTEKTKKNTVHTVYKKQK